MNSFYSTMLLVALLCVTYGGVIIGVVHSKNMGGDVNTITTPLRDLGATI